MAKKYPPEELALARKAFLAGEDGALVAHLGFYVMWFAVVEVQVTAALAAVLGLRPLARAEVVMRGMDARVKCDRLRQAAKKYHPIGPNLAVRLKYFEKKSIPLRNSVVHTWPVIEDDGMVHFDTMGRLHGLPQTEFPPASIHLDELMCEGLWLNHFSQDLQLATFSLVRDKKFEIDDPKSSSR